MKTYSGTNINLPFISTSIPTDIFLVFVLVPLWWVLGLDHFIWFILTFWIFSKLLLKKRIVFIKTTKLMLGFLLSSLISACFIEENYRVLTFMRNFLAFASVWLLTVCLTNTIKNEKQIEILLWGLAVISFFASFLGLLAITDIFSPRFEAPTKYLIPGSLRSFGLVRAIYSKGTSAIDYFAGRMIIRPTSFFMGCTTYGMALVIFIPIVCFLFIRSHGLKKLFLFTTLVLLLINLGFNMTRGAILSLFIATVIHIWKKFSISKKYIAVFPLSILISYICFDPDFFIKLRNTTQSIIDLRGPGSQRDRMTIYKATLQQLPKRLLFGYGTQRDFPEISDYPVGSHSGYLGVLYRYGLIGFFFYVLILFSIYKHTKMPKNTHFTNSFLAKCMDFLSVAFYGNILHQFVEEPDLDLMTFHIVWLSFGLLITAHRLLRTEQKQKLLSVGSNC